MSINKTTTLVLFLSFFAFFNISFSDENQDISFKYEEAEKTAQQYIDINKNDDIWQDHNPRL